MIDKCDIVLAGADRIAANGDTANKVGTRMLATLARAARKPFYIVAPTSTFDSATPNGDKIVVEQRDGEEVRGFAGCRAAPKGVPVFNPAFDVTQAAVPKDNPPAPAPLAACFGPSPSPPEQGLWSGPGPT